MNGTCLHFASSEPTIRGQHPCMLWDDEPVPCIGFIKNECEFFEQAWEWVSGGGEPVIKLIKEASKERKND